MRENKNRIHNLLSLLHEEDIIAIDNVAEEEEVIEDTDIFSDMSSTADWLNILPVKNTVLFPGVVIPITVAREKSIKAVKEANKSGKKIIGVIAQKNQEAEMPEENDLYLCGTVARILKLLKMPDGSVTLFIQGRSRFQVQEFNTEKSYLRARVIKSNEIAPSEKQAKALVRSLKKEAFEIIDLSNNLPQEAKIAIDNIDALGQLSHFIASNLSLEVAQKQEILEINDLKEKAEVVLKHLDNEVKVLQLSAEIQSKVKNDLDKQQREYILRQQIRAIQGELGESVYESETESLRMKAALKKWTRTTHEVFDREVARLSRLAPQMPDYGMILTYLEWMLALPWLHYSGDKFDFNKTKKILDAQHYGLEKVKDRILEHLAVLKLKTDKKSPILCFYGPPGVGKTSLAKSIATALGREMVRISLGGLKDEAEIRGHRRTYIGALPGKIIQGMKKSKTGNPVFILDELDKVGNDFRGDPSSALLEVLDPEQNYAFQDHYLETEYDLSKVMFIATANSLSTIHPALADRLEIIEINGYSLPEKIQIAKKHLIPEVLKEHGLSRNDIKIADNAIEEVIEGYTRESGVRKLTQQLAALCRVVAKKIVMSDEPIGFKITKKNVAEFLGVRYFENEFYQQINTPGVAIGLAWTPVGGDILFIESLLSKGAGKLSLTGQLGEVMKESAALAYSFLKSHSKVLNIPQEIFEQEDVHLHIPAGAIPKDGPSAGIAMLTALASLMTGRKVKSHLAMSGEITLRGKVLPVGGVREKVLAAERAGIKTLIFSTRNEKDIKEIKEENIHHLEFIYTDNMLDVLNIALEK